MSRTLSDLIRGIGVEFPDAHPHKLARLVAERTDPADLFEFYVTALERLVADRIRLGRNNTLNSKNGRSPKLAERRAWWQRVLAERVHVGESRYKPIAECTLDDFTFCIAERRDQQAALEGQIVKFQTIAAAMEQHGALTAGELPDGAVEL